MSRKGALNVYQLDCWETKTPPDLEPPSSFSYNKGIFNEY